MYDPSPLRIDSQPTLGEQLLLTSDRRGDEGLATVADVRLLADRLVALDARVQRLEADRADLQQRLATVEQILWPARVRRWRLAIRRTWDQLRARVARLWRQP